VGGVIRLYVGATVEAGEVGDVGLITPDGGAAIAGVHRNTRVV